VERLDRQEAAHNALQAAVTALRLAPGVMLPDAGAVPAGVLAEAHARLADEYRRAAKVNHPGSPDGSRAGR
jgi:hypothetical protein